MAILEMNYYSKALECSTQVTMILPEREKTDAKAGLPDGESYKTLWLFHGLSSDHTAWMRRTNIERYASEYGIAVVMPNVGRSWYTDMCSGAKYFTFVTEELPNVCRGYFKGMSAKREDNLVAGLSMGGYGAIKAALRYPDNYFACISLSGSLDITRKGRTFNQKEWRAVFDYNLETALELEGTEHEIFHLTRLNKEKGEQFPKFYLWCGTEDVLVKINRDYRDLLNELNIPVCYEESEGDHSWKWWDLHIQDGLRFVLTDARQ